MIEWWRGLTGIRKFSFAAAVVAVVAFIAVAAYWVLNPDFIPLFDGAAPEDSASLVADLESLHAPYKIDSKTGAVLVPQERRDELRVKVAEHGTAQRNPVGFELFNNSDFGMTEFSQRINYERGLEGELTRTIMSLDGVRYARVHLVLPESTLFRKGEDQAKASVTLMTRPDHGLPEAQIKGIRRLVAAAVPGLKPDAVSIHDYRGVDLASTDSGASESNPVRERVRDEEAVEARLAAKVYDLLRAIFPPGSVAVSVDVRLRMDKISSSRQETSLEAPKSTELSQLHNELSGTSADPAGDGAKADNSNPLAALAVHADAIVHRGSQYSEQIEKMPGTIDQLSVGVLVPEALLGNMSLEQLQGLVSTAVGADLRRNDRIAVYGVATLNPGHSVPGSKDAIPGGTPSEGNPLLGGTAKRINSPLDLAAALIGLLAIAVAAFVLGRNSRGEPRLTKLEREKLIEEIRLGLKDIPSGERSA
ncbi:flagellar basal-body MS-ring/collar protein FliF [Nevskia soli]|uniref:flagellar basal-body MS-ring/collar protein FliF n=1 Tax=Nevskia soli TaxID=418856 RepID=UPI000A0356E9|nr:flagellar basal-body MS-ring/collar protein FliF [Nevskia soli]